MFTLDVQSLGLAGSCSWLNRYTQVKGNLISSFSSKDIHMYIGSDAKNDGEVDKTTEPEGYYQDIYAHFRNM
jgi:hypothetical protein